MTLDSFEPTLTAFWIVYCNILYIEIIFDFVNWNIGRDKICELSRRYIGNKFCKTYLIEHMLYYWFCICCICALICRKKCEYQLL